MSRLLKQTDYYFKLIIMLIFITPSFALAQEFITEDQNSFNASLAESKNAWHLPASGEISGSTFSHIFRFDGNSWTTILGNSNNALEVDSADNIYGAGWGINIFSNGTWTQYNYLNSPIPNIPFRAILKEGQNIWAGFDGGFVLYDGNNWIIFDSTNSPFNYGHVRSIKSHDSKIILAIVGDGLVIYNPLSSLQNPISNNYLNIYPNPAQNYLHIEFNEDIDKIQEVEIFDFPGAKLLDVAIIASENPINIRPVAQASNT